ncbi:MAG: hypothetical protein ABW220_02735, partial [Burkholderiaceae bacterium]
GFDFVAFVPLAACTSRAQVLDALLASLHLRQHDTDPFEPLIAALTGRRALLVLDNFEQLGGIAEDVVARITALIPTLHLLVTSRRVLGLDGERELAVPPLVLPRAGLALDEAAINPAVALFVDRARAVRADFHLGPSNLAAIVELVHLLEGMPLAIELAAARSRSIAPAPMAELLRAARRTPDGRALELLTRGGPRSATDLRHASMLRVIEWSWRLLDAPQAELLAALTVFHGGFTAAAVEAVCGALGANASVKLDELVAHSLLRIGESADGTTRFATFEPVREYAALQLDPIAAPALRARHRAWLTDWATHLPPTPVLAEVRAEMPNLLAALTSALADDAPDDAIRLVLPLRRVLEDVELPAGGLASLGMAIERSDDDALRHQGHSLLGPLLFIAGRSEEALQHVERGLAGTPAGAAWRGRALQAVARVRWRATRNAAHVAALLEEAERLVANPGANAGASDLALQADLHALRGFVANRARDTVAAQGLHAQALALWERLGNQHAVNKSHYNLAASAEIAGRRQEVLDRLAVLEPRLRSLNDWAGLSQMLNTRGNAQSGLRQWAQAVATYRECVSVGWECMALHELIHGLWNMPRALAHVRDAERAVELAAFAAYFWETRFGVLDAADRHYLRLVRRLALRQMDRHRLEALWQRGQALPLAEAVALALR